MKINNGVFRKKCLSEKYYASIKYMSHALKGKERRDFITRECDINIYLGCQCAVTCEQDRIIEKYINKRINNYFKPQEVYFYDKVEHKQKKAFRRLRSFDIANYLLACNLMGYMKAIKWYIYNHSVSKSILIQLASEMNEDALLDFMLALSRSEMNKDKLRGIGSTKNLFQKKKDYRVKEILKILWGTDKDAYVQLAYDTGLLGEIWKTNAKGKSIYIHILNNCAKPKRTLDYLIEVLGEKELISILEKSVIGKNFLYLVYLDRLQRGYYLVEEDYLKIKELPMPPEKICNYFIPCFLNLRNPSVYMENLDYSMLYECFGKLYTPLKKKKVSVEKTDSRKIAFIVKNTPSDRWKKVVELYFRTCLSEGVSFDDMFQKLNKYHDIQVDEIIEQSRRYPLEVEPQNGKVKFLKVKTENYLSLVDEGICIDDQSIMNINDYDYISKTIFISANNNTSMEI